MSSESDLWRTSVEEFVREYKASLRVRSPWWCPSKDWISDLATLGLTQQQAKEVLQTGWQAEHCSRGPEPDDDEPVDAVVFIFRVPVEGILDAYVKLALKRHPKKRTVMLTKIWSFKKWT